MRCTFCAEFSYLGSLYCRQLTNFYSLYNKGPPSITCWGMTILLWIIIGYFSPPFSLYLTEKVGWEIISFSRLQSIKGASLTLHWSSSEIISHVSGFTKSYDMSTVCFLAHCSAQMRMEMLWLKRRSMASFPARPGVTVTLHPDEPALFEVLVDYNRWRNKTHRTKGQQWGEGRGLRLGSNVLSLSKVS